MSQALPANLLELIAVFSRLVEAGSFTAVAREMGSTQPTVSRQLAALEAHLGVRLFHRTTRSLTLTEEGRAYYEHAALVLDAVEGAEAAIRPGREHVRGRLRIAGPLAFTRLRIVPRLRRFLAAYPDLDVELVVGDHAIDLVGGGGVDVAIRIGEVSDQSLVVRRVGETRRVAVASPDYLRGGDRPSHPGELARHDCIVFTAMRDPHEWIFADPASPDGRGEPIRVRVDGRVRVNASEAMRQAVLEGLGVALVPTWLFARGELDDGTLTRLLPDFEPAPMPIQVVYPSRRMVTPRLRAFVEFVAEEFRADPVLRGRGVASAAR